VSSTSVHFEEIRELEQACLSAEVRRDPDRLGLLIADEFVEFGSSGRVWDKGAVLETVPGESGLTFELSDFAARDLGPNVVHATFRVSISNSESVRHSLRSSLWVLRDDRWQLLFHQGTPSDPPADERRSAGRHEAGQVVEFFFSPGSRYCYLAATQLARIADATSCRFDWRPVRGNDIRLLRGRDPFQGDPVSGQYDWAYRRRDAEMWAECYGVPFHEPPSHEFDFDLLSRAAAAASLLDAAEPYGAALCRAVYGSGSWPLDRELCLELADRLGLSRAQFDRLLDDPATRELLAENARDAHARGAFGVPTFFVGETMYWGNDRLGLLEHALTRA